MTPRLHVGGIGFKMASTWSKGKHRSFSRHRFRVSQRPSSKELAMAETLPGGNGAPQQQLLISAQYVKDFSFENPRAPQSLMQQSSPPEIKLDINVSARPLSPENYEVLLAISARAARDNETVFLLELTYAAVATLQNVAPDDVPTFVLVEAPRLIFPFARAVIADATRDGGFPPLFIHPVDFADLLRRQHVINAAAV
jgi:preprotein translocase subunit SecB